MNMDTENNKLSVQELNRLQELLTDNGCSIKSVSMLDGLIASAVCTHGGVTVEDWIIRILGEDNASYTENDGNGKKELIELLSRFIFWISDTIAKKTFIPTLPSDENDDPVFTDWVLGFKYGIQSKPGLWEVLVNNKKGTKLVIPIYMADAYSGVTKDLKKIELDQDDKIELAGAIGYSVSAISEFLEEYCLSCSGFHGTTAPIVNDNKTGRNDPCPCGSGKKYKKCCLEVA